MWVCDVTLASSDESVAKCSVFRWDRDVVAMLWMIVTLMEVFVWVYCYFLRFFRCVFLLFVVFVIIVAFFFVIVTFFYIFIVFFLSFHFCDFFHFYYFVIVIILLHFYCNFIGFLLL